MADIDIISALRDDNQYYNGIGKNYLSNSDIGVLLSNPQDFGKEREDNKASNKSGEPSEDAAKLTNTPTTPMSLPNWRS